MSEENKALVRRELEEIFNEGKLELADELLAPDYTVHDSALAEPVHGIAGFKRLRASYHDASSDVRTTIDDMVAEGDRVVTRWTTRSTHDKGEMMGVPPTGKRIEVTGITLNRISGGKIAEDWTVWDSLGLLRQLGAVPDPGQQEGSGAK
ncbi:MAG: ester cyclase [Actinomycetota bacterium]|nr:ester cyclase [Actinomycetota bacterium]